MRAVAFGELFIPSKVVESDNFRDGNADPDRNQSRARQPCWSRLLLRRRRDIVPASLGASSLPR